MCFRTVLDSACLRPCLTTCISARDQPDAHMAISHHTDAGAVTVLTQTDVCSLQVLQPDDGKWYDVEPEPGCFVINTGDIMQVWSNNR